MENFASKQAVILAQAEKELEKARKECAILGQLPIEPRYVHAHSLYGSSGSVAYEVKTKGEAYGIYSAFAAMVCPTYKCTTNRTTSFRPTEDEKAGEVAEMHATLAADQFGAELEFFVSLAGGQIVRVCVKMPLSLFGSYRKSDLNAKINYQRVWSPLPKTNELHLVAQYAAVGYRGEDSYKQIVYAMYDSFEVQNQFEEVR